jgi:hypothetical protein
VTDGCGGRILPFGVRQLLQELAFVKFNNYSIREAVRLCCSDLAVALKRWYGDINDRGVSQVPNCRIIPGDTIVAPNNTEVPSTTGSLNEH